MKTFLRSSQFLPYKLRLAFFSWRGKIPPWYAPPCHIAETNKIELGITLKTESASQNPLRTPPKIALKLNDQLSERKVRYLFINRFSEQEISRQLAAICQLFLLALSRDFGIHSPKDITIEPSDTGGVKLRIIGRD